MSLFSLENLYRQYIACRANKRNTINALRFEARQELNLLALQAELVGRSYEPGRSVCFLTRRPKLREVFAADFRDRIVHHVLVGHLEARWEPRFIFDSYACRRGKGVHAGVARLQQFLRQATANGTRRAWYLQLDIRNYFMSIDKARLLAMLVANLGGSAADDEARWLCETLVAHDCTVDPVLRCDPRLLARLPAHKTLFGAPAGRGLPIGNLNSQFFANVYLDPLDQFVKHELKCRWYLRYCDDFVLLAEEASTLRAWRRRIRRFLEERLGLALNDARQRLRPVGDGIDFLGYVVRHSHLLVRRRVLGHLHERVDAARRRLVVHGGSSVTYRFDAAVLEQLRAALASWFGHLRPAASHRLVAALWQRHAWLLQYFQPVGLADGLPNLTSAAVRLLARHQPSPPPTNLLGQYRHWQLRFPGDRVWIQVGAFVERLQWPPRALAPARGVGGGLRRMRPNRRGAIDGFPLAQIRRRCRAEVSAGRSVVFVGQSGRQCGRLLERLPMWRCCPA